MMKRLREIFPIACDVCGQIILSAQRNDEDELLADGEPYRLVGIRPSTQDSERGHGKCAIPIGVYAHTFCLGIQNTSKRLAIDIGAIHVCQHCNKEIDNGDACEECLERIKRESKPGGGRSALMELMRNLSEMRAEANEFSPPQHETRAYTSSHSGRDTEQRRLERSYTQSSGLIENPDRLGVYEPTNELGLVFMFGQVIGKLNYKMAYMDGSYPDCVMRSPSGELVRAEMEYVSSNFIAHRHNPDICDLVVCWKEDKPLPIPVLALRNFFDPETGAFDFSSANRG